MGPRDIQRDPLLPLSSCRRRCSRLLRRSRRPPQPSTSKQTSFLICWFYNCIFRLPHPVAAFPTHPSSRGHIMRHHGMTVSETHRVLAPNTNATAAALQSNSPSKLYIKLGKLAALLDADHATRDRERLNFCDASEIVALSHTHTGRCNRMFPRFCRNFMPHFHGLLGYTQGAVQPEKINRTSGNNLQYHTPYYRKCVATTGSPTGSKILAAL